MTFKAIHDIVDTENKLYTNLKNVYKTELIFEKRKVGKMKLGFIGTGNMASAIMGGIIKKAIIPAEEIIGADLFAPGRERVQKQFGIHVTDSNKEVVEKAEVIILSVKPQFYESVINEIKDDIKKEQIVITIAPGKTLAWLSEKFGKDVKLVRTMPNTPAMVGEGMTAACPNEHMTEEEIAYVRTLLESFSRVEIVPERLMDVVVSVSGSSPAYVFVMIEAMADAAGTVVDFFKGKIVYINVMKNLSVDCDCCEVAEDPCMKDIGILASTDPVAVDQACIDLVYAATDDPGQKHFLKRVESRNGVHTIESAAEQGYGSRDYELINID